MNKPHIFTAHKLWQEHFKEGFVAIDATCGNGHDALILANLAREHKGHLFCLDIQEAALAATKERLREHLNCATLIHGCHSTLPAKADLIVYNLGYLPGADKSLTTQAETTLESLKSALKALNPGGLITIMCYPGHPEGAIEEARILDYLSTLSPKEALLCHYRWINRPLHPSLFSLKML